MCSDPSMLSDRIAAVFIFFVVSRNVLCVKILMHVVAHPGDRIIHRGVNLPHVNWAERLGGLTAWSRGYVWNARRNSKIHSSTLYPESALIYRELRHSPRSFQQKIHHSTQANRWLAFRFADIHLNRTDRLSVGTKVRKSKFYRSIWSSGSFPHPTCVVPSCRACACEDIVEKQRRSCLRRLMNGRENVKWNSVHTLFDRVDYGTLGTQSNNWSVPPGRVSQGADAKSDLIKEKRFGGWQQGARMGSKDVRRLVRSVDIELTDDEKKIIKLLQSCASQAAVIQNSSCRIPLVEEIGSRYGDMVDGDCIGTGPSCLQSVKDTVKGSSLLDKSSALHEGGDGELLPENSTKNAFTKSEEHSGEKLSDGSKWRQEKTLQLRLAGGWVRDKVLGYQSSDIDVAVEQMTGLQFAEQLKKYLDSLPTHPSHGTLSVVARNPAQSKHLETAQMKVLNYPLEFVNLRTEDYSSGSRIPNSVQIGTPEQDAFRRDFTINALFYNLFTQRVEDHTGYGLRDLEAGLIRTPLAAHSTLLDDPLRCLRAVRFCSRYGFRIESSLQQAMSSDIIHEALRQKVSKDRIGQELKKMWTEHPRSRAFRAVHILAETNLLPTILMPSVEGSAGILPTVAGIRAIELLEEAFNSGPSSPVRWINEVSLEKEHLMYCILALLLLPFNGQTGKRSKGIVVDIVFVIIGDILKLPTVVATRVHSIQKAALDFSAFALNCKDGSPPPRKLPRNSTSTQSSENRVKVGQIVREVKQFWSIAMIVGLFYKLGQGEASAEKTCCSGKHCSADVNSQQCYNMSKAPVGRLCIDESVDPMSGIGSLSSECKLLVQQMNKLYSFIKESKLDECWCVKPLLNGHQVGELLPKLKGSQFGPVMAEQIRWMLESEGNTNDMAGCKANLLSLFAHIA